MTELLHADTVVHQHSGSAPYTATQLRGVPPAAVSASTGIGNPVAVAAPRPGQTVVDLGGGAGLDAIIASRLVGQDGHVYLIDNSPLAVSVARRNARHALARNITCVLAEMDSAPVPPAGADVVISNHALSFAAGKADILRRANHILKPTGTLVCALLVCTGAGNGRPAPCPHALLPVRQLEQLFVDAGFTRPVTATRRVLTGDLVALTLVAHTLTSPVNLPNPVW